MNRLRARALWLPKEGSKSDEWEDACAYSESAGTFAVADGASSSTRAHEWASTLVARFLLAPDPALDSGRFDDWAHGAAEAFDAGGRPSTGNDAWYVQEAASRASFATFLGLRIEARVKESSWQAVAVGDTCLFHIRDGALVRSFPLESAGLFNSTPPLVSSAISDAASASQPSVTSGTCLAGDTFLLASDALAEWALRAALEDSSAWRVLDSASESTFRELVGDLRAVGALANDDVTLLRCRVIGRRR